MPSRLLREGILDSDAVNSLTAAEEVFYRRLMSVVDDFGRFDGRLSVLRSRLYPLQIDRVREADISRWIAACEKAGLIALYERDGRQYILFHKLGSPRAASSKYPNPPPGLERQLTSVYGCAQTNTGAPDSDSDSDSGAGSGAGARARPPTPRKNGHETPGKAALPLTEATRMALEKREKRGRKPP